MKRRSRPSALRRAVAMLACSMIGTAVAVVGCMLAAFGRDSTRTSTALTMALVLGASLSSVGIGQYFLFEEDDPRDDDPLGLGLPTTPTSDEDRRRRARRARLLSATAAVIGGLGAIALIAMTVLWIMKSYDE